MQELPFDDWNEEELDELDPIPADEAERVITALNKIMAASSSESVAQILEEACCEIASLIPEELDEDFREAA